MTLTHIRSIRHRYAELQRYRYSDVSEFPAVCFIYSGYDVDGYVDDENVSLSVLAVLFVWGLYIYDCLCCTQIFINRTNTRCLDVISNSCCSGVRQLHRVDLQTTAIQKKVRALGAAVCRAKSFPLAFV